MQSSNRDEWASRLKEQWTEELNAAKAKVEKDDMCMFKSESMDGIDCLCWNLLQL